MGRLITTITATKKLLDTNTRELLSTNAAMESIDEQIKSLHGRLNGLDAQGSAAAVDILTRQRNDLRVRGRRLENDIDNLLTSLNAGYRSLNRVIFIARKEELPDIIAPVGNSMTGYLLPVLYGALGTCAFILRSLYGQMLDRSFDPRRSGEFVVRLFLGMLSGVTVQWVFTRDSGMPDGATPLVLAFLAGYSVELLFTGMDRLLATVTGRIRPPHASPRAGRPAAPPNGIPAIAKPEPIAPRVA